LHLIAYVRAITEAGGVQGGCSSQTVAESFVKTIKRGYVSHMPKSDRETALRNLAIAFEHYNEQHPHSALKYRSPREFRRLAAA